MTAPVLVMPNFSILGIKPCTCTACSVSMVADRFGPRTHRNRYRSRGHRHYGRSILRALLATPDEGVPARVTSRSIRGRLDMNCLLKERHLRLVRDIVRRYLTWWEVGDNAAEKAVFAVHELLTNMLKNAELDVNGSALAGLLVRQVPGGVTAVIRDGDPRPLERPTADPFGESSRGLVLVRALVDELSVPRYGVGKDVWFYVGDATPSSA
ncbi:ATP-binding protein [Streptomyces sp. NPDC046805]|uniref:ATP-binding protein n=1 Tax=Streptomyces sp. NPDC046805 TaxID=3155134 RepID=UPI0033D1A5CE